MVPRAAHSISGPSMVKSEIDPWKKQISASRSPVEKPEFPLLRRIPYLCLQRQAAAVCMFPRSSDFGVLSFEVGQRQHPLFVASLNGCQSLIYSWRPSSGRHKSLNCAVAAPEFETKWT